jgi:hypothetical protein
MDKYSAKLRKKLASDKELATQISTVLAKFDLAVPEGMTLVWCPTVIEDAKTLIDAYGILINGIPNPRLLDAAFRFEEQFRI